MKKIFALISILTVASFTFAQDSGGSINKFRFGFKVAPSLAWMKPDVKGFESNGSNIGFIYGLMMDYSLTKNYAISTGAEVSYRGGKLTHEYVYNASNNNPNTFSGDDSYSLKYVDIPVTIKMKTNEIGYFTYYGQFGLQPGIKISAKEDFSQTKTTPAGSNPSFGSPASDANVDVSILNLSLLFGLGLEYRIGGNTAIMVGIQFSNGFTDVLTGTNHDDTSTELKAISNYLSLNVGVFF